MPRMFGTDGVRGLANRALTAQLALDLGDAAVRVLGDDGDKSEFDGRRRALVGRDTRVSGDFLAAALSAGMSAGGFDRRGHYSNSGCCIPDFRAERGNGCRDFRIP